jgi:hypothetical protein
MRRLDAAVVASVVNPIQSLRHMAAARKSYVRAVAWSRTEGSAARIGQTVNHRGLGENEGGVVTGPRGGWKPDAESTGEHRVSPVCPPRDWTDAENVRGKCPRRGLHPTTRC